LANKPQYASIRRSIVLATLLALNIMALWSSPGHADGAEILKSVPVAVTQPDSTFRQATASNFDQATGRADPTPAWQALCQRMPAECAVDLSEPVELPLTTKALALLRKVTTQVNATIKPIADMEHWGIEDHWDFAEDGYGDCEDFQLVKRKRLIEQGLPRRPLRMAVVVDQDGKGHAVLLVRTTLGDLVLDNMTSAVLAWNETSYWFVKREGQDGLAWVSLLEPPL
jgi:predicted transglutaminase-like cysteine proteinase